MNSPPPSVAEVNQANKIPIIIGVIFGSFLAALDTTILATVMPTIVGELGGMSLYGWVFSVYMIMTAISMPLWGKLSDTLGKRSIFFAAVGLFLFGSMLCGTSQSMMQLIVFRGIQGIGAGGLASVPFALISTVFPPHERGKALGFLASTWGLASVIGPLAGSVIIVQLTWRWVFYVNVPGGIAAIAIVSRFFSEEVSHQKEKIDYLGAALLCCTILSLLLIFMRVGKGGAIFSVEILGLLSTFLVFLMLFVRQERSAASPVLELHYFRRRSFWVGNLIGFVISFAMYGVIAYVPLFSQSVSGGTALQSGVVITSMSLAWSLSSVAAGRLIYRVGEKRLIWLGTTLMALGFLLSHFISYDSPVPFLLASVMVIGSGMGWQTPSLMLTVQHSLDPKNVGVATSTQMLARTIGGAVGVSVMGAAMTNSMLRQFESLASTGMLERFPALAKAHLGDPQELLSGQMRAILSPENLSLVLASFTNALHSVFSMGLVMVLIGLFITFLLPASSLHTTAQSMREASAHNSGEVP